MEKYINEIFDKLDQYKGLPAYQLERRVDIFFAIYLKEILEETIGNDMIVNEIIPEFPLLIEGRSMHGHIAYLSNKVDYFVICENPKMIFLVELKTEMGSIRSEQHDYLKAAREKGLSGILENLNQIYKKTKKKKKYDNLFQMLQILEWKGIADSSTFLDDYQLEIVYIIPRIEEKITNLIHDSRIITFDDIILALSNHGDTLTIRFRQSLENWKHS